MPRRRWLGMTPTRVDARRVDRAAGHGHPERVGAGRADRPLAVEGGDDALGLGGRQEVAVLGLGPGLGEGGLERTHGSRGGCRHVAVRIG